MSGFNNKVKINQSAGFEIQRREPRPPVKLLITYGLSRDPAARKQSLILPVGERAEIMYNGVPLTIEVVE